MTATDAHSSPVSESFNESLRDAGGKSTVLTVGESRFSVSGLRLTDAGRNKAPADADRQAAFRVVLDAGHGGKDPGGMGKNSHEKHIALNIVRLLAIGIRTNFPAVEVILTRSDDTFIPLHERAQIANDEGADLFISVHANIMPGNSNTYGTETFVMGQHVAGHNLAVAKRENASILLEDNVEENYGYDPNSDEGHIMMSTFQHAFLERSILFADLVESEFEAAGRKSRGVKQAGFAVLKNTTMPSVLVETGFMSNPTEETFLLSGGGQQKIANALLKAFKSYLKQLDGADSGALNPITRNNLPSRKKTAVTGATPANFSWQSAPAKRSRNSTQTPAYEYSQPRSATVFDREVTPGQVPAPRRQWTAKGVSPQPLAYHEATPSVQNTAAAPRPVYDTPASVCPTTAATGRQPRDKNVLAKEINTVRPAQPIVYQRSSRASLPVSGRDSVPSRDIYRFNQAKKYNQPPGGFDIRTVRESELTFVVQLMASKRIINLEEQVWKQIPYPVQRVPEGEWQKYQVRNLACVNEARQAQAIVRGSGFPDAMVVIYHQGRRVAASQTKYLLSR